MLDGVKLSLQGYIRGVKDVDVSRYECQYVNEDLVNEVRNRCFCEDCPLVVKEPDLNCADCPTDFDYTDIRCYRYSDYIRPKRYLMFADILLRNTLGDLWSDEYTA